MHVIVKYVMSQLLEKILSIFYGIRMLRCIKAELDGQTDTTVLNLEIFKSEGSQNCLFSVTVIYIDRM